MSWDRAAVASALAEQLGAATGVMVHERPPDTLNPMTVVVSRPQPVSYGIGGLGVDQAVLPVVIVGGLETEDQVETLKAQCRKAVEADPTLGGVVQACWPTEERNWRNATGAGGIQLLLVELILTVEM